LNVGHPLSSRKLFSEAFFLNVLLLLVQHQLLLGESFDAGFLSQFSLSKKSLLLDLVLVCLDDVVLNLLSFLLTLEFTDFFPFKIVNGLTFDKLALKHFFFECLDEVEFEFFKLV